MKPIPFKISKEEHKSIKLQVDEGAHFYDRLHYHPEVQITTIVRGEGIVYGGNNMLQFTEGDTLIFGPDFPHLLKNAPMYYTEDSPGVLSHSIFFDPPSFGGGLFAMPEMATVQQMLADSTRGIVLTDQDVSASVSHCMRLSDSRLIAALIDILIKIEACDKAYINAETYRLSIDDQVGSRMNDILAFTFSHLHEKISVTEAAAVAALSTSQFSRYFKRHTGKSYIHFLNDLRIESACTQLRTTEDSVQTICYSIGFQNISNFNRIFRRLKGTTPSQYRKMHHNQ